MSRNIKPIWKQSRRLGYSLLGTGKELQRRPYAPGQHGRNNRSKPSEYSTQLKEKQKARLLYGLNERQFRNLFVKAGKVNSEYTHGENLLNLLESRLDNLVFKLGFALTRRQARQLVNHGHVTVDGKRVDIPSYIVEPGQVISLREKSKNLDIVKTALDSTISRPNYVSFEENKLEGTYVRIPVRDELDPDIDEQLIVEYYNKRL
ncbi:30S ribosomal protein S4 [Xylocopilactobacillus apicola]|uniref:Small ribosomal subunit protein uS4 n=1 Tax=Xylocopilactobacillus apicola TaxID=2932184 RepID=A0AAU9D475_9LACO|nr:30S ribosomal protein S4 [Xylocopilactobacillus apicola]BDR58288.1 30S ribosomal protein S4 [Xylocopilactobacillus apicola]